MALLPPRKGTVLPALRINLSPNRSSRATARPDLIVLHSTEGAYGGAVSWLCNAKSEASAHVVLSEDGSEATQLVPYDQKAWACAAFNSRSLNLECAGFSGKLPDKQLRVAARIVAYWCHLLNIPARNALGARRSGITFHQDLGIAGGGHHDPGFSALKKSAFVYLVKWELKRGGFRPEWGQ